MEAIFPGSFDPLTLGHYDIIKRTRELFDKVYVAIGLNIAKSRYFTVDVCINMIKTTFDDDPGIEVISYNDLTIDLCKRLNVTHIVRGIRNIGDFEYERSMAETNRHLHPDVETIFFNTKPKYSYISSTIIRELIESKSDIKGFVHEKTYKFIQNLR